KHPHLPGVDRRLDGFDEPETLVLQEIRGGRGEEEQRMPPMSVGHDRHVLPQDRAVPARNLSPITIPHRCSPPGTQPKNSLRRRITSLALAVRPVSECVLRSKERADG